MNNILNFTRFTRMAKCMAAGAWLLTCQPAEAIITADSAGTHTTTPGQPFSRQNSPPLNVDGVVQIVVETTRPATGETFEYRGTGALIADRYVLTAAHVLAQFDPHVGAISQQANIFAADNRVRFNLAGGEQFVPIAGVSIHSGYFHPFFSGNDIAVIELADDAPAAAPRYPLYNRSDEFAIPMVKVGYGESGWGNSTARSMDGNKRAGFNTYDANETYWAAAYTQLGLASLPTLPEGTGLVYDFDSGFPQHDGLGYIGAPGFQFGVDEVFPAGGDSGSPGFLYDLSTATFKVAGVTSLSTSVFTDANHPISDSTFGETAIDTRVSAFTSFIQDTVSGEAPTLKGRVLNNGQQWTAGASGSLDHHALRIADSNSGAPTTLEIQSGATVGSTHHLPGVFGVEVFDHSAVQISDGVLESYYPALVAHDQSSFELNDGTVRSASTDFPTMSLQDSSTGIIRGGSIEQAPVAVQLYQNASLTVAGGSVTGERTGVRMFDESSLTITGGSIVGDSVAGIGIETSSSAMVSIMGGTVTGGMHDLVNLSPESRIRVFGRGGSFNLPLGEVAAETGTITGLFADGTPFDFSFFRGGGGVIELVAAAAGLPGDYNNNGTVDAADYVVWRKNVGAAAGTLPNDAHGGVIGPAQYAMWRSNFGMTNSSALAAAVIAAVPEPAGAWMQFAGVLATFACGPGSRIRRTRRG
jgi:secreted trypsin-like serine protease